MKNLVLHHPACLSYPNIKSFELHPRLPICLGYWDGTTTCIAPNANPLDNSGIIMDLLRLTDNPKGSLLSQTHLTTLKSSRPISSILRMAITVHIHPIGEDSENEDNSTRLPIKQDPDRSTSLPPTPLRKNKQPPSSRQSTKPKMPPFSQTTIQNSINLDNDNTTSESTTKEDSPSPSDICPPAPSNTFSLNSLSASSTSKVERPSTPKSNINTRSMST